MLHIHKNDSNYSSKYVIGALFNGSESKRVGGNYSEGERTEFVHVAFFYIVQGVFERTPSLVAEPVATKGLADWHAVRDHFVKESARVTLRRRNGFRVQSRRAFCKKRFFCWCSEGARTRYGGVACKLSPYLHAKATDPELAHRALVDCRLLLRMNEMEESGKVTE